jgi:hypothetical protein
MRIIQAIGAMLVVCALSAGGVQAAGSKQWMNLGLHLGLTYPDTWHVVPERGAALKVVALDADGEFELFSLPAPVPPDTLATGAGAALTKVHCGTRVRHTSSAVGRLDAIGSTAVGTCTGADRGWQLTVTMFNYRSGAVLTRSWLFHGQPRDGAALAAIATSLVSISR